MFCFQLSLLLFKSIPHSHHLDTCRRAEQNHTWQLQEGKVLPWREITHPLTPPVPALTDGSRWGSALLSCLHAKPFLQCLHSGARHWCQGFHPFQFLWCRYPFASRNIPVAPAGLLSRGKRFRWLCSLVFAKGLHSC